MRRSLKVAGIAFLVVVLGVAVLVAVYRSSARLRVAVSYGTDPGERDIGGWTALHEAAARGDIGVIEVLIERGFDSNARTARGETAWHIARLHNRQATAAWLEEIGVETAAIDSPTISGPYMGQKLPGETPELFMPGIVSGHYPAHSPCVFAPNLTRVFWTAGLPPTGGVEMMQADHDYTWSLPVLTDMIGEVSISPDGQRMYFMSLDPVREGEPGGRENIWIKDRTANGWSNPRPLGQEVNGKHPHFHHSVDWNGNLYFSDYNTLYVSAFEDGVYQEAVDLAELFGNETLRGNSPYISPAGDMLLFAASRGLRGKELVASFKRPDGSWTDRVSLGDEINSGTLNDSPRVTPDGLFIFFVSAGNERPWGIYWTSSSVLDRLKHEQLGTAPTSKCVAARGATPTIDGWLSSGEWDDATFVDMSATRKMLVKHDGEYLYLAFEAPGSDVCVLKGDRVHVLHASFGLGRAEYVQRGDNEWAFDTKTPIALHGLQKRPSDEIRAELARHLQEEGWAGSLIPMGQGNGSELVVSFEWLGVEMGSGSGPVLLPKMAAQHNNGPPHLIATWPTGNDLQGLLRPGTVKTWEVGSWGEIALGP